MSESIIKCPNCGHALSVEKALATQTEDRLRKEFDIKLDAQRRAVLQEKELLENERQKLLRLQNDQTELLRKKFEQQKDAFLKEAEGKAREQLEQKLMLLQQENDTRKQEITALKKKELEVLQLQNSLKEQKEQMELDMSRRFLEKQNELEEKIKKTEQEKNELKYREYEKKLEDQKKLIDEMKRKAEQGSMQMQGEVQELAIEAYLSEQFPLDTIEEIKKGERGADCVQIINSRSGTHLGKIYYESKRTKEFQKSWIEKLKADMRTKGADIGVLITEAMPKEHERLVQIEGVWVCSYEEFKGLCRVLRESVLQVSTAMAAQENRGEKMHMLYDYLTGNEFKMQVEAIVEGFVQMKEDLDRERRSMEGNWKRREKQIEKVLLNTNFMYSSIRGIAGSAVLPIKALEMPDADQISRDL
jgi:hypothetical protein